MGDVLIKRSTLKPSILACWEGRSPFKVYCQSKISIQFRPLVTIFEMGHKIKERVMQREPFHSESEQS